MLTSRTRQPVRVYMGKSARGKQACAGSSGKTEIYSIESAEASRPIVRRGLRVSMYLESEWSP